MQQILLYGDSLSWGIIPETRRRLSFDERWPGVMENALTAAGRRVRVLEDCLNGRRTVWEDPFKPGRKGIDGLAAKAQEVLRQDPCSGAVFAFLGLWIVWDWRRHRRAGLSTRPITSRVLVLAGLNVVFFFGLGGMLAWQSHLGSIIVGTLAGWYLERRLDARRPPMPPFSRPRQAPRDGE